MSADATILVLSSFVAGIVWTSKQGSKLGVIALTVNLFAAVSFYFALGWLAGFLDWMNANDYTSPSIETLIWSGLVTVPFFLGTATTLILKGLRRTKPNDRSRY